MEAGDKKSRLTEAAAGPSLDARSARSSQAEEAEAKAAIHLGEALAMSSWGGAPNACIHSAYYAMYFIAVAALLRAGGVGKRKDVPESHEHVIQHYAKLAETLPDPYKKVAGC